MNRIRRIVITLAGFVGAALALTASAPSALATLPPPEPGGTNNAPAIHTVVTGGMPGWQIALIAVGAALLAAVLAVLLDRVRTTRGRVSASV